MSDMHKNLIAGKWLEGVTVTENRNPSDISDLIGLYASGTVEDVHRAAEAAAEAQRSFFTKGPQARAELLERIAGGIEAKAEQLACMLAREEGKIISEARAETIRAAQIFRFFAGEALRISGESLPSVRAGVDVEVRREPLGVVALITPWNFPIAIPAWKIAPALAYGNSVILKPADLTPGTAHLLAEIIVEAGCPAGLFNLVMGPGSRIGTAMLSEPLIQAISFTGSVGTGRGIARAAAESLKKVQLEMGGKNPMIVMDDANIDLAVAACLNGAFFSTGQRCTASSRLIVHERIHDIFVDALTKVTMELKVGPALALESQMGPVASASQLDSNLSYVALAREEGCEVVGGERMVELPQGHFQRPAIFVGAKTDMRVSREEIFGPCASVIKVADFEEAVAVANDTEFGLSSGICTRSLNYAREFQRRSTAGMVMVNLPTAGVDYHVPFGGRKGSSHGPREQGRYAAEFYTAVKTNYVFAG
jgi:aldehyde dehydrogenase (NAD+)